MDVWVVIVIGVVVYCLFDRWCVHRERMVQRQEKEKWDETERD
ncbi:MULTISPECIES: hypothetical protein [Vibrio harveyi group]|nr:MULTISPECIES: hypothetical protein [Vibrio harveyi group]